MTRHLYVTLTTAGTVYDLLTLIRANAVIAAEELLGAYFQDQVSEIVIQADGGTVTLVDSRSDSLLGIELADSDSYVSSPKTGANVIAVSDYKLIGGTNATKARLSITVT